MVIVRKEVEEIQMALNLDTLTDSKGKVNFVCPNDIVYKQRKEQEVIDAVHEMMGAKVLGKFIHITKDNENEYLEEYRKAKEKLHMSQFRQINAV